MRSAARFHGKLMSKIGVRGAWEAAGSYFVILIRVHFGLTIIAVYAPTNPSSRALETNSMSNIFYEQL